jgi:signal transduction histidine kinase/DNA-binding response OmpR family regulator/ligand-binding sensor domain-containing protein
VKNRFLIHPILFTAFIFTCILSFAQPPHLVYQDAGDPEDYSSLDTWCVFQDSRGLIWIGTALGLDRWDGNRLHSYPFRPFDQTAIPALNITSITEDEQNNLWLGTGDANSLIKFDLESEEFTLIKIPTDSVNFHYTQVKFDPAGFLWVGCFYGLFRYYPDVDSLVPVPVEQPDFIKDINDVGSIELDTAGGVWVTDFYMHLYYWDRDKDLLIPQHSLDHLLQHHFAHAYKMSLDREGNLLMLGTRSEILKLNPYEKTLELIKPGESFESSATDGGIEVDEEGNIWYGMGNGLMFYNTRTGETTSLETSGVPQIITDIQEDNHGNILVATENGLKVVDKKASGIRYYTGVKDQVINEGLWINNIISEGSELWLGTYNAGVIKYNTETGEIVNYREGKEPGSLPSDFISSVAQDRKKRIWILSGQNYLNRYDGDNDRFEFAPLYASPFITQNDEGLFWYCWWDHLLGFDPVSQDTFRVIFKEKLKHLHTRTDFFACAMDHDGIFWLGGTNGLTRINQANGEWNNYNFNRNNPQSLPTNQVNCIYCDSQFRVWAGTTVGLFQIFWHSDISGFSCQNVTYEGNELGFIYDIIEDNQGNIWAATQYGLSIIKKDGTIENYTTRDGLPEYPKFIRALNKDSEGKIYAGTFDILEFPPDFLEPNKFIPDIMITELLINGYPMPKGSDDRLRKSILFAERIDLDHDQNFIRLDFAALNYEHPERNRYRYILEGVDRDTVDAGHRSFAEYTDLAPGTYRFWITGSNNTGLWNPEGTSLIIRIRPPWYQSTAALVSYVLLILLLIYVYIRLRTSRLRKDKARLETEVQKRTEEIRQKNNQIMELDTLKTRFFANISHEFRTLVTLVKAPAETLLETEKISLEGRRGVEMIYRNANRLMRLVTQLLDISKIDRKNMKLVLSKENIFDFAHSIAVSFSSLAEVKGIQYHYYLPRTDAKEWFDADKLEKIINNLLSNAFKFTDEGGKVRLDMVQINQAKGNDNLMEITISDTGNGIPEEEQAKIFDRFYQAEVTLKKEGSGTGIGLAHARELVDMMHGSIEVKSTVGKGSTFTVRIPLGREHLNENEYTISETGWKVQERGTDMWIIPASERELSHSRKGKSGEVKKPRILVVEDNADILWLLSDKLGSEFEVMEAVDGSAGLKLATEQVPDLVITDLMMPRMDGIELCRKLKTDLRTSHIPVIMLTAKATPDDKLAGLETGADDYITKPFEIIEVLARSRNLVAQRRKLREKFSSEIVLNPREIVITSTDEKFLTRAMDVIDRNMSNEKFDVTTLCEEMNMSHSTLFRKLDALTDQSPVEFIRTLRLKRAAVLLKEKYGNVTEVALEVGFSNPSYFSRMFKKTFAVSPAVFSKLNLQNT